MLVAGACWKPTPVSLRKATSKRRSMALSQRGLLAWTTLQI
jgi:hypothetical protein